MQHPIYAASAIVPTLTHERSLDLIATGLADPVFGEIDMRRVQLCPQHRGYLGEAQIETFMARYPETEFRLHASPKLAGVPKRHVYGSNIPQNADWIERLVTLSELMVSRGYSIHAGLRQESTIDEMIGNVKRLEDRMSARVAVEGLYPARSDMWLMSSWQEYEKVANSGVGIAIDLSHLNIVARRHGRKDDIVRDILSLPNCVEVHVSHNDGRADSHRKLTAEHEPWWLSLIQDAHAEADFFYEGILVMPSR